MTVTFSLGIPHTPWVPSRSHSFIRLVSALGAADAGGDWAPKVGEWKVFSERVPNHAWSAQMWNWAAEAPHGRTHFLTLQDDVIVSPSFWAELTAMVEAYPDRIIGLETVHPQAKIACDAGARMVETADGLVGVGYVVPVPILKVFLEWRATNLCKGAVESVTEDTLLCVFGVVTGRRFLHPTPTIIDHDTSIASTYGNDAHGHRRPVVTWRDRMPGLDAEWWRSVPPMLLDRFYGDSVPRLARRWVKGATDADWERWLTC